MELLDRYLEAVKKHLPWKRQDDIVAELRANFEAQLDDKQTELGRKLNDAEMEAWLKQIGSPIQVAARYQQQQYLIGPALFPTYSYILRLVLSWVTVIYVIGSVATLAAQGSGFEAFEGLSLVHVALRLPWIWLINAAITTFIFAAVERVGARYPAKVYPLQPVTEPWSPFDLAPVDKGEADWAKPWSFAKALAEVIFGYVFFAWLLLVPHYPYLMFGPGAWYLASLPYKLAQAWWPFYWWVVVINGFELAWKTVDFASRGAWQKRKIWRTWAMHTLSLIPLGILLAAPGQALFLAKTAAANDAALAQANKGLHTALIIALAVVVFQLLWNAGKMAVEAYRKRVAA